MSSLQLEVYSTINWYVEVEQPGNQSRLRTMGARELLYQLPFLQRLQRRLLDCVPRGQAARDHVVLVSWGSDCMASAKTVFLIEGASR